MTVIAVTMVKNELDVIETTVRHMAAHVDHVIVADNGSTDGTRDVLKALPCEVIDDPDPAYYQSRKMTALAHYARTEYRADWVVPFDADEIWLPLNEASITAELSALDDQWVAPAWVYDHVVTDADPAGIAPQQAMAYRRRENVPLHKVACRTAESLVIAMGNHQATYGKRYLRPAWDRLQVRHYPIRSPQQYLRKARQGAAALALTDLPDGTGQHWRDWNSLADQVGDLNDAFLDHWYFRHDDERLIHDPAPLAGR